MCSIPAKTNCLKVLIVEDEVLLAMDLESTLEHLGHNVVGIASHAAQALAIANKKAPDLALVDVNLDDGATGPQIASSLVKLNQVSVVFVTGNPEQIPPDYVGAIGAIVKPWTPKTIEQLIAFVQDYREGGRSSIGPATAGRGILHEGAAQRYSPVRLMCSHPKGET